MTTQLHTTTGLAEIEALYDRGLYVQAAERARPLGDPRTWPGAPGAILAGRLAYRLGAPRLGQALHFRAFRNAPGDPMAAYYRASMIFARRGPWHALLSLRSLEEELRTDRGAHALALALEGRALAAMRDFERAHARIDEAEALDPCAYVAVERAYVHEHEDDLTGSRRAAELALARAEGYRPALSQLAHLLAVTGEREAAIATLSHAGESWEMLAQRAELAFNLHRHEDCERDIDAAIEAAVWLEPRLRQRFEHQRAEAAYLRRAYRRAAGYARASKTPFGDAFATRLDALAADAPLPRVELSEVPHIQQHHETCAPASIAQVSAFFGEPIDHLALASEICWGGTPDHLQRAWAERTGRVMRQFEVQFETVRRLIDAGVPVLLSTAWTTGAHLSVIIGYDEARSALLVRDPSVPDLVELATETFLAQQAWHGPMGAVLLPAARASAIEGIPLPASELYDLRYQTQSSLQKHDVAAAEAHARALVALDPAHRVTLETRRLVAAYRLDRHLELELLEQLLALHPDTGAWVLRKGELMRGRNTRAEQLAYWRDHALVDHEPLLVALAEELRTEARFHDEAARLLRRALRLSATDGLAHHVLADLEAGRGRPSLESYRLAVCLTSVDEHFAQAYAMRARYEGREDEALALLERRVAQAGARSAEPAKTLFGLHRDRGNPEKGLEILEALLATRPDDGDLAIEIALGHLAIGELERAAEKIGLASSLPCREEARRMARADILRAQGKLDEARAELEAVLALGFRLDALHRLLEIVRELEGPAAAIAVVEAQRAAHPNEPELVRVLCVALRDVDDERAKSLLREQLGDHPDDHWSRRELALALAATDRLDEGLEVAREAVRILPYDATAHGIVGHLLGRKGDVEGARAALRRAIEIDVDSVWAIRELRDLGSAELARDDARFVLDRLLERVSQGHGLTDATVMSRVLPHEERITRLREVLRRTPARPDGWQAVIQACVDAGELDEAERLAGEALERFPRWAPLHLEHALVLRLSGRGAQAEQALQTCITCAPAWPQPRGELARALRERGELARALSIVDEGLARAPRAVELRIERIELLWAARSPEAAFDEAKSSLLDALYSDAAFELLYALGSELGRVAELQDLVRQRMDVERQSCVTPFRLALLLPPARVDEQARALHEALRRNPRFARAADRLAEVLAEAGRHDEALAACPPPEWVGTVPISMEGRRAWILERSGRVKEAVAAMRAILERDPGYGWGRRSLADWLDRLGDKQSFLQEAETLVRLEPHLGLNHLYLADALLATGDRAAALASYRRAWELAPENAYAATRVVDLELEDGTDARPALERARHVLAPGTFASLRARACAAAGDHHEALDALEQLLGARAVEAELERALDALASGPLADDALALVEQRLTGPEPIAGEVLGRVWARVRDRHRPDEPLRLLRSLSALSRAGVSAVATWIELLGRRRRWWPLAWLRLRHGAWLRAHTPAWGAFGYALVNLARYRLAARWLSDWTRRSDAQGWMLFNLVIALWAVRRGRGAREVGERALAIAGDPLAPAHRLWMAFEHACHGRLEEARAERDATAPPAQGSDDAAIALLIEALLRAREVPREAPLADRIDACAGQLGEVAKTARGRPDLRGPYDAAVAALVADRSWVVRWWVRAFRVPDYHG